MGVVTLVGLLVLRIDDIPVEAIPEVKTWLKRSWEKHQEHWAWVLNETTNKIND